MLFHHLLHARSHGSAGLTPVGIELDHGGPAVAECLLQGQRAPGHLIEQVALGAPAFEPNHCHHDDGDQQ